MPTMRQPAEARSAKPGANRQLSASAHLSQSASIRHTVCCRRAYPLRQRVPNHPSRVFVSGPPVAGFDYSAFNFTAADFHEDEISALRSGSPRARVRGRVKAGVGSRNHVLHPQRQVDRRLLVAQHQVARRRALESRETALVPRINVRHLLFARHAGVQKSLILMTFIAQKYVLATHPYLVQWWPMPLGRPRQLAHVQRDSEWKKHR